MDDLYPFISSSEVFVQSPDEQYHWHRLTREVLGSPSLEIFKTHLDRVLCSLLWVTLLWRGGWTG